MEDTKSKYLYRKAIKDFPDRPIETPKKYTPTKKNTLSGLDIVSKSPILPFEKLSDVVAKSATEPNSIFIAPPKKTPYTPSDENQFALPTIASGLRDLMGIKVGEQIIAKKIDPYTGIPVKTGYLSSLPSVHEATSPTLSGDYNPVTGNIRTRTGLSPEDFMGTYAHEAGHKIKTQGLGLEGKSPNEFFAKDILNADFMNPEIYKRLMENRIKRGEGDLVDEYIKQHETFEKGVEKPIDVAKLVDKYYSGHHRADEPRAWETQALENLKKKGILEEPFTPEARPENIPNAKYRKMYRDLLKKRKK